jgi:dienelactone hydrolase
MDIELRRSRIEVARGDAVDATLLEPRPELPGVLFVHGWGGSQVQDLSRAREIAAFGCVCLTFDLRGHHASAMRKETVTRGQNLDDLCAAYDWLAGQPQVDPDSIAVVGISYGAYLAALLSESRPVRWLALRTPAIYMDRDWELPKRRLHDDAELANYRRRRIEAEDNRALHACSRFKGDVLLVEAECDEVIPRQVVDNYARAFAGAHSMTRRLVRGADHGFTEKPVQRQYTDMLVSWMNEMVIGSRGAIAAEKVRVHKQAQKGDTHP